MKAVNVYLFTVIRQNKKPTINKLSKNYEVNEYR